MFFKLLLLLLFNKIIRIRYDRMWLRTYTGRDKDEYYFPVFPILVPYRQIIYAIYLVTYN